MKFDETDNVLLIGSKDQTITTWSVTRKAFGKHNAPDDVIKGMGASVEFLFPFDDVVVSASTNVTFFSRICFLCRIESRDAPQRKLLGLAE